MQDCVPALIELLNDVTDTVHRASLKALTNLSLLIQHHQQYVKVIGMLYDQLDRSAASDDGREWKEGRLDALR